MGRHRITRELARGGMGAVYVARDPLGRDVAVKVLLEQPSSEEKGGKAMQRFGVEAESAARLRHPGIVGVHEFGQDDLGRHYIAMDLVPGESLGDRIERDGALPLREAARVARDVAQALEFAHGQAILHRDMKPDNVLLTPEGRAIITDFGIAKVVDQAHHLTMTGAVVGTPAFMPPEQALGQANRVDARSDVYSLGATLYCMLTTRPPVLRDAPMAMLVAILEEERKPPSTLRPEVDADLDAICLACLEIDSDQRYGSAAELAADLDRYLKGEPVQARVATGIQRATRWLRSNALATVLVAIGALAIATAVGAVVWLQGSPPEGDPREEALRSQVEELNQALARDAGPLPQRIEDLQATMDRARAVARDGEEAESSGALRDALRRASAHRLQLSRSLAEEREGSRKLRELLKLQGERIPPAADGLRPRRMLPDAAAFARAQEWLRDYPKHPERAIAEHAFPIIRVPLQWPVFAYNSQGYFCAGESRALVSMGGFVKMRSEGKTVTTKRVGCCLVDLTTAPPQLVEGSPGGRPSWATVVVPSDGVGACLVSRGASGAELVSRQPSADWKLQSGWHFPLSPVLAISPGGSLLAVVDRDLRKRSFGVRLIDTRTSKVVATIPLESPCSALQFSADGELLVCATGWLGDDLNTPKRILLWRVADGTFHPVRIPMLGTVVALVADPSSPRMAAADDVGMVFMLDLDPSRLDERAPLSIDAGEQHRRTLREYSALDQAYSTRFPRDLAFSLDGQLLHLILHHEKPVNATKRAAYQVLETWDVRSGKRVGQWDVDCSGLYSLDLSQDGKRMLMTGREGMQIWRVNALGSIGGLPGR